MWVIAVNWDLCCCCCCCCWVTFKKSKKSKKTNHLPWDIGADLRATVWNSSCFEVVCQWSLLERRWWRTWARWTLGRPTLTRIRKPSFGWLREAMRHTDHSSSQILERASSRRRHELALQKIKLKNRAASVMGGGLASEEKKGRFIPPACSTPLQMSLYP